MRTLILSRSRWMSSLGPRRSYSPAMGREPQFYHQARLALRSHSVYPASFCGCCISLRMVAPPLRRPASCARYFCCGPSLLAQRLFSRDFTHPHQAMVRASPVLAPSSDLFSTPACGQIRHPLHCACHALSTLLLTCVAAFSSLPGIDWFIFRFLPRCRMASGTEQLFRGVAYAIMADCHLYVHAGFAFGRPVPPLARHALSHPAVSSSAPQLQNRAASSPATFSVSSSFVSCEVCTALQRKTYGRPSSELEQAR
jgi:hypothetical protein